MRSSPVWSVSCRRGRDVRWRGSWTRGVVSIRTTRVDVERAAIEAGDAGAARVDGALRELFAADAAEQTATPLEVVRTAYREPTAVLAAAGIPPVDRDAFAERAWPDDRYGLVPHTLADLGDPTLAPLLLAWGMAKAAVLRART